MVKYWILILVLFASSVQAAPKLSMRDVLHAFLWVKFEPNFPVVITREEKDFLLFRIFDDRYLIERKNDGFAIHRKPFPAMTFLPEESVELDSLLIEKVLYFSKADSRSESVLSRDYFYSSIRPIQPPAGFQNSQSVFQCKSDLPARPPAQHGPINKILHHTWIQNGRTESFGMPNTDLATYFGGLAHVRSPDSFIIRGPKNLECAPVWKPTSVTDEKWNQRFVCIARALSLSQNPVFGSSSLPTWVADLDYHVIDRNCLMATRLMVECAGGKAPITVNSGIGGKLDWNDTYAVHEIPSRLWAEQKRLQFLLKQERLNPSLLTMAQSVEVLMNSALDVDAMIRGEKGLRIEKNLSEICKLAQKACQ